MNRNPPCRVQSSLARIGVLALAAMLLHSAGCSRQPPGLVVATCWPAEARRGLEADLARWAGDREDRQDFRRVRIEWLPFRAGDDPLKLAFRATPPHVILGGSAGTLSLLADMDRLSAIDDADRARWCEIVRTGEDRTRSLEPEGGCTDPRRDRASLLWAKSQLSSARWREGYARLVQSAAKRDRVGASYDHPPMLEQARAQRFGGDGAGEKPGDRVDENEGVAIVRGAGGEQLAQGFLRFLVETRGAKAATSGSGSRGDELESEEISSLIADLLGSTLVDAQDELWAAVSALDRLADREQAVEWLNEPPPWPPASVAKYLSREGERAMALIETLAALVAPEAPERAWLLRSWLAPARPVDPSLLSELTEAAGGRLCREVRFRAWLREEWTAWARQRYRRVARWAGSQSSRSGGSERTSALR